MEPRELPIPFRCDMVRAIHAGRKTMTRRIIKPQPLILDSGGCWYPSGDHKRARHYASDSHVRKGLAVDFSPYRVGDVLFVKETWGDTDADHPLCKGGRKPTPGDRLVYRANPADDYQWSAGPSRGDFCWRSSRYMPKRAARLWLEVTEVRAERLQDITEEDAIAEGIETIDGQPYRPGDFVAQWRNYDKHEPASYWNSPIDSFHSLWDSLNAKRGYGWDTNPWVLVYRFVKAAEKSSAPS